MDNFNICHVQIMEEFLTSATSQLISDDNFNKVKNAYELCLTLLWIEEKFNIITANFLEFEQEVYDAYNFISVNTNDKSESDEIIKIYGRDKIISLNRRIANILGSIRMYRDQVSHDLSKIDTELKEQFTKQTNIQYDKSLGYQIMEFIRNYMQHEGMIIERLTAIIPFFNRTPTTEILLFAEVSYRRLEQIKGFSNKIKLKDSIEKGLEWINIIELLRQYYIGIINLHNFYRKSTENLFAGAIYNIEKVVGLHYNYDVIRQVAFMGKKSDTNYKDFLFQKCFIDDVVKYRNQDVCLNQEKYYLNLKTYISSNRTLKNSVRHSIRYNML